MIAVGVGYLPVGLCLLVTGPLLVSADFRRRDNRWRPLALAGAASVLMLITMVTPPGWALFDWYVD